MLYRWIVLPKYNSKEPCSYIVVLAPQHLPEYPGNVVAGFRVALVHSMCGFLESSLPPPPIVTILTNVHLLPYTLPSASVRASFLPPPYFPAPPPPFFSLTSFSFSYSTVKSCSCVSKSRWISARTSGSKCSRYVDTWPRHRCLWAVDTDTDTYTDTSTYNMLEFWNKFRWLTILALDEHLLWRHTYKLGHLRKKG